MALRSRSSRGRNGSSIPTPKSKPSSTKYPAKKNPMRPNQSSWRSIVRASVADRRDRGHAGLALVREFGRVDPRVASHQPDVEHEQQEVQADEDRQAGDQ